MEASGSRIDSPSRLATDLLPVRKKSARFTELRKVTSCHPKFEAHKEVSRQTSSPVHSNS